MTRYFFFNEDGQWVGPLRRSELVVLYRGGCFGRETPIMQEGGDAASAAPYLQYPFPGGAIADELAAASSATAGRSVYPQPGTPFARPKHYDPHQRSDSEYNNGRGGSGEQKSQQPDWVKYLFILVAVYLLFQFVIGPIIALSMFWKIKNEIVPQSQFQFR